MAQEGRGAAVGHWEPAEQQACRFFLKRGGGPVLAGRLKPLLPPRPSFLLSQCGVSELHFLFPSGIAASRWACSSVQLGLACFGLCHLLCIVKKNFFNFDLNKFSFLILNFYLEDFAELDLHQRNDFFMLERYRLWKQFCPLAFF